MEEITTNAKIVTLDGTEMHVHFSSAFPYFWVLNLGDGTVLMSVSPNISEGKDGVIEVIAGSSAGTMHGYNATSNDLYLIGSGKVQIMGTYTPENPFKQARKGGENHINDGLAYGFSSVNNSYSVDFSGYQYLYTPFTIEFCGSYKNFYTTIAGIGMGRWFVIHNGAKSSFAASQRENVFQCLIFGTWFDTGETDITIEKNEFVTISMVITQQTVDLYKNGEFVKSLDISDNSTSYDMFSRLVFFRDPFVSSRSLDGKIESFRIYDRELTESEILHNFDADKALYFKEG